MSALTRRLLLVDDSVVDREAIRRHLGAGYETCEASTAEQARLELDRSSIDCALLDYRLPDMDGLALLGEFHARDVPVIMLTGQGDETVAVEAMKRGAQDYLVKGRLDDQLIRRTVTHALERQALRREIDRQHAALEARTVELERHRAELEHSNAELREREAKLRIILEQLPAIVWTADAQLRYTSIMGLRWRALGVEPADLLAAPVGAGLTDAAGQEAIRAAHLRALGGGPVQFQSQHGSTSYQGSIELAPAGSSRDVAFIGVAVDVSAARELERQLRASQKMDALGKLAAGVAHDFNNLLSVILSYSSLLVSSVGDDDPSRADLEAIQAAGERAAVLTRQLLAFSRQQVLAPKLVNVNEIVLGMTTLLQRIIGEDVELAISAAADLGMTKVDPGQVEQIVMNLVVNARDAMPGGGKLTIETANVYLDQRTAEHLGLGPGPHVMLSITDSGHGMDATTKSHIFEPFFTTKEVGKGTGLGLSTVLGIVQQSGGGVGVHSEVGRGTAFQVYFPRCEHAQAEATGNPPAATELCGTEKILLVEDDDRLRAVLLTILRQHGYRVLQARSGDEALQLGVPELATIDLLLTDVVMPRMNGRQLSEHIVHVHPGVRVLFMSGYTDDAVVRLGVLRSEIAFLEKPITPVALVRKVREVLDVRAAGDRP